MRKKILLVNFFSLSVCLCVTAFKSYAQERADLGKTQPDSTTYSKDSVSKDVRLLYNRSIPSNLTAVSSAVVYNKDLIKSSVANVSNALTGRLAGLSTSQSTGLPGSDAVSLNLRGQAPLILIDGIPRSLTTISLEEIESVTVLKDALGTAMLGVRGSNGALLITTKQGMRAKQTISFTAQTAFGKPLNMPRALDAFNYATLRNEAYQNELKTNPSASVSLYSAADLQAFQDGSDPIGHPNVNWNDSLLRSSTRFDRYNLNISGGSSVARYFVALEHFSQEGLLKTDNANNYDTNNGLKNYEIRSNIDLTINPKLTGGIHLFGRIQNLNQPGSGINSVFSSLFSTPANAYPTLNPNGSYAGTQQFTNNLWAQSTGSGYQQTYNRDILADFYLRRSLDELTKGLWVKAVGSYSTNVTENIVRNKTFAVFQRTATAPEAYTQYGTTSIQSNSNNVSNHGRQSYFEMSVGYNHTINDVHGFDVIVLANRDSYVSNNDLPYTFTGTSGRVSYNYKEKYILEAAYGFNGSNRYPPDGKTQYSFFPAVGLGWNITKESFMKSQAWLNHLKLSGTYGRTGNDNPGYFNYIQRINDGTSAIFGTAAGGTTTKVEGTITNPNLTVEKANKLNIGLEGSLIKNQLSFSAEYYNMKYYDLLRQRGKNTSLLGNTYPSENIGQNRYEGWDLQLGWQNTEANKFRYFLSANAGIQKSKVLYIDEVNQPYSWMYRTGQPVGQSFGYISDGLFQTQAEINSSATFLGYTPQPGDIKYKDLNGDGFINQFDQTAIGTKKPFIFYGVNLGFDFKGFDFSALVQGAANRYTYLNGSAYWEFQNNGFGQAYEQQLNRWTPATAATATYPRLGIGGNTNNQIFSTYWFRKSNYVRLKNIELGYTLSGRYAKAIKLQSIRLFANGSNLFTSTPLKDTDPEVNNGNYPIQRAFNIGVNVKL